jgi:predicted phage-related endonuclease
MIINYCTQGEDQWHEDRIGNPGATGFSNIITSTGQPSKSREKYMYQMAEELITGEKPESFKNAIMIRGTTLEPEARTVFSQVKQLDVEECGMIYPDDKKRYHISPDGIMQEIKKGFEIKCPSLIVHDKYCDKGVCPTEYRLQVQGSMMVTGYGSWFFMSYFPGLKPFIREIFRDEKLIDILRDEMDLFIDDLDDLVIRLKA